MGSKPVEGINMCCLERAGVRQSAKAFVIVTRLKYLSLFHVIVVVLALIIIMSSHAPCNSELCEQVIYFLYMESFNIRHTIPD